jgi:hypothetical protein
MKTGVFWDVIRVTRIGELGTSAVTNIRRTLRRIQSETSVLTRATRRNIPEDSILHGLVKSKGEGKETLCWVP